MRLLFVHQNMPGQFKHLAPEMARLGHEVVFLTQRKNLVLTGVRRITYPPPRKVRAETHHYLRLFENCVLTGQQVVRAALALKGEGFTPDVIVAHPGWGETLFLKDIFPRAKLLSYCEFYYSASGADVGFLPEDPADLDTICRVRARNAHLLLSLEACDAGISPTHWQRSRHPAPLRDKIEVVFDGIDTAVVKPDAGARFALSNGRVLTRNDEVVTYIARNLEPYRGFPSFVRALPALLAARPQAQVVIVGGDEISYGKNAPGGKTWREHMLSEVEVDPARVHFVGKLPYREYLTLLQISALHLYLTVPFVLSWSAIEALAAGCLMLGSSTSPVEEVVSEGVNGFLCDFHDPADIATKAAGLLETRGGLDDVRQLARETVLERYALPQCLARQVELVRSLA